MTLLTQDLLTDIQCGSRSGSFVKETRALTTRSAVTGCQKLTVTNCEPLSELILLKLHENLPKNSVSTILQLFSIWSRCDRWWSSIMWVPHEPTANKIMFSSVVFSHAKMTNHFSIGLSCDRKWISYDSWQWPDQWLVTRRSFKALPKAKLAP